MFAMDATGRKISAARKAKNMTQMELADRLNISFQAVSNWERGVSMPDISKLPEISELLDVSIDELLGKSSALVKGLLREDADAFLNENTIDPEELMEAAPILKPEQVRKVFVIKAKTEDFDHDGIEGLLPFLGQEECDILFEKVCAKRGIAGAAGFAPFVSEGALYRGAIAACEARGVSEIAPIAPFLLSAHLTELVLLCLRKAGEDFDLNGVEGLLPFLEQKGCDALFEQVSARGEIGRAVGFAPFVSSETLYKVTMAECEARGIRGVIGFAPFMRAEHLGEVAKRAIEKEGLKAVAPLAPFLGENLLRDFLKNL